MFQYIKPLIQYCKKIIYSNKIIQCCTCTKKSILNTLWLVSLYTSPIWLTIRANRRTPIIYWNWGNWKEKKKCEYYVLVTKGEFRIGIEAAASSRLINVGKAVQSACSCSAAALRLPTWRWRCRLSESDGRWPCSPPPAVASLPSTDPTTAPHVTQNTETIRCERNRWRNP